ncbi:unnamed protein product [Effrenium voratum]|nr:unnamed protein product [Effrenium voratum]
MISFTHDLQIPQLELSSCYPKNARNATEQESIQLGFSEPVKAGHGFFELWDVEDTSGPKIRVDVQSLALTDVGFYGRKLIDQNLVRAFPDALCDRGACRELESGITYFLTTSNVGVLYDMMDNPLPMLDTNTSGPWRFEVNENVTRAPEILRVNYAINMSDTAEVFGYVYFTQRVFQNGSFPGTVRRADSREIMIHDCGTDFDCAQAEEITDVSVTTDSWSDLGGVPGVLLFRTEVRPNVRLQVTVPPWSFMGADTRPGSLAGPLQPYTFLIDTGPDPRVPPIRPFILPDGRFPSNQQRYVPANTNITLYFSDEVRAGAGNISFCISLEEDANTSCVLGSFADGHVATLDVSHAEVQRRIVTWALPQDFAFGQALRVVMPEGLFVSANTEMTMEEYTGYSFSIQEGDIVPPRIIAVEPTARPDGLVKLIFSEAVLFEGAFGRQGSLALEEESSQAMVRFDATVEGAVVKLHGPFKTGESYRLRQTAELMDLVGNRAITVPVEPDGFSISEDVRGPEARLPMLREVHMHDTFFIEFDEAVVPSSTLRLVSKPPVSCGPACGRSQVLLDASAAQLPTATFESLGRRISLVQVEPPEPLLPGVEYELTVPASFVEDAVGNPSAHTSMQSYLVRLTRDLTPPKLMAVTLDGQGAPMSDFHQDEGGAGLRLYFSEALRPLASGTALQLAPSDGASRCSDGASRCLTNCTMPCGYMPAEHGLSIKSADVEIRGAVAMVRKAHLPFLEFGRGYRRRSAAALALAFVLCLAQLAFVPNAASNQRLESSERAREREVGYRRGLVMGGLLLASSPMEAMAAPKTILVAGATGQTGRRIVERLSKTDSVAVLGGVRDVTKAQKELSKSSIAIRGAMVDEVKAVDTTGVSLKPLDVAKDSVDKLAETLSGCDALVIATGFVPGNPFAMNEEAHKVDNLGTKALVDAAKKAGVGKVVMVSSILTNGRGWGQENSPGFQVTNAFGNVLDEKLEAEKYLRASGLDWTIVRPGGLKASAPSGSLVVSKEDTLNSGEVSRDLVADVSIAALFDSKATNRVVEIIEDENAQALPKDKWFA